MGELRHASIPRPPIHRIILAQVIALVPPLLLLWWAWPRFASAFLAGAIIEVLGRAYFSFYAFRYVGARQMREVVRSFRRGEMGKFILVAVLFGLLFALFRHLPPVAVFAGYLLAWLFGTVLGMRLFR
jgi:ATP synthase protein I